ncbi:uncharacterized protein LOC100906675 [Galendromus occidentalis]|uniref:Uncharacterized protein LOC100906675 n=1 Tax=Galendromus occidentalis TaxID=34638 RepID=A0AAJ6QMA8_9ACAR|nr:uncharacterized protein LOC100906675 [Galendromus occidentalis]
MSLVDSIVLVCLVDLAILCGADSIGTPIDHKGTALDLFRTLPDRYASVWGETFKCKDFTKDQVFELHGLPTALNLRGEVVCGKNSAVECSVPVRVAWLRMHTIISSIEDEAFFEPFEITLSIINGEVVGTGNITAKLSIEKSSLHLFDKLQLKQMVECARVGLEHLIVCLMWGECRTGVVPRSLGSSGRGDALITEFGKDVRSQHYSAA